MEDYIQLYQTLDGYAEQNGGYEYEVPPREGQVQPTPMYPVYSGEIIMDSLRSEPPRLTDNKVSISVTYNQSAFTATTMVTSGGELYYAILRRDIDIAQDGQAYPGDDKIYQLCSGNSIDDLWNYGTAYVIERDGLWNGRFEFVIDFTGGFYCTFELSDDRQYFSKKFTKSQTTTEITVDDQTLQAYTFTSDNLSTYGVQDENGNDRYSMLKESGDTYVFFGNINEIVINKKYRDFIKTPVPAVAYIENENKVLYNYVLPKLYRIRATYNVETTSEPIAICAQNGMPIETFRAVLDDETVLWEDIPVCTMEDMEVGIPNLEYGMDSMYQFQTTGTHTIDFYYNATAVKFTDGYKATGNEILLSAFHGASAITHLEFFEGITTTGSLGTVPNLTGITIPVSITKPNIGVDSVFYNGTPNQWVTNVKMEGWNPPLGYGWKLYCDGHLVEDLVLSGVKKINAGCFWGCESLTSLTLDEGVEDVIPYQNYGSDSYQFVSYCKNLKVLNFPDSFNYDHIAVYSCPSLETVRFPSAMKTLRGFNSCFSTAATLAIPDTVERIGASAFTNCYFCDIDWGQTVEAIEDWAFCNCSNIRDMRLPDTITSFGDNTFRSSCKGTVTIPGQMFQVSGSTGGYNSFSACSYVNKIVFEEGVKIIPDHFFYSINNGISSSSLSGKTGLNCIEVPSTLEKVGSYPFMPYTYQYHNTPSVYNALSCLTFNANDWMNSFSDYNSGTPVSIVTKLGISYGITYTGYNTYDKYLKKIVFGPAITNIPKYAVSVKDHRVNEIHFLGTTPPTTVTGSFTGLQSTGTLYVPTGCSSAYATVKSRLPSNWKIVEE